MKSSKSGFSLIELMVSISIIAVLTTVLLGNRSQYTERLALKNETYKVALYLRQAQVYSLGVRAHAGDFSKSYGVHFDAGITNQVRFFTDENSDGKFQIIETNEVSLFSSGVSIQKICGTGIITGLLWCSNSFPGHALVYESHITFKRPNTNSIMKFINIGNGDTTNLLRASTTVYLISKTGLISSIKVESSGAVSIQGL